MWLKLLNRGLALGLVLLGGGWLGAGVAAGAAPVSASVEPMLGLAVASAKPSYAPGEAISLTFTVTNRGPVLCRLGTLPETAVQVVSVRRDGGAVEPELVRGYYLNGAATATRAHLRDVDPGQAVSFTMDSVPHDQSPGSAALTTAEPLAGGDSVGTLWPVDAEGRYELSVSYRAPRVADGTCRGGSGVATVSFTVGPAGQTWPVVLVIAAVVAGCLLLGLVVWLLARRRRTPRAVTGVLLIVAAVTTATFSVTNAPRAGAAFDAVPGLDGKFRDAVFACLPEFVDPATGLDAAQFMKIVTDKDNPIVVVVPTSGESQTKGRDFGPVLIKWNPDDRSELEPGVPAYPCASLYHELFHAKEFLTGESSNQGCANTGIKVDEVQATFAENKFRKLKGLPLRTMYDGNKLPQSIDDCLEDRPRPRPGAPVCRALNGGCGVSNGDPHLVTFDRRWYDFQAVGEFVATRSSSADLEVQVRQSPVAHSKTVAVNSAVAVRVGSDRIGFYLDHGVITVRLNGQVLDDLASTAGLVTRRPPAMEFGEDGYTVKWPDGSAVDVEPIGYWGLVVYVSLAPGRAKAVTGLLGDFDGDPGNDRGADLSFEELYKEFGEQWRVRQADSLFDYAQGQTTETFTDRSYPERLTGVDDLPAGLRSQAEAMCELAGVSSQPMLDACILDAATTGQPIFAMSAGDTEAALAARPPSSNPVDGGMLATLRGGDTVGPDTPVPGAGQITAPGEFDRYELDLGGASEFRILEVTGDLYVQVIGPDGLSPPIERTKLPGVYSWRVPAPGRYFLKVSGSTQTSTGPYAFRFVTVTERHLPASIGDQLTGRLDAGQQDLYTFAAGGATKVRVTGEEPCDDISVAVIEEVPDLRIYTPYRPCWNFGIDLDPERRYVVVVWSDAAGPVDYAFRLERG